MTKSEFISLLNNPSKINEESVNSLNELKKSFPYCQISYMLLAKATHDNDSMHANEMLKKAAAYSTHRQVLKKIINSPKDVVEVKSVEKREIKEVIKPIEIKPISKEKKIQPQSSSIIDELKKTLEKSKEVKKEHKIVVKSTIEKSVKEEFSKVKTSEVDIKFEKVVTEKKKPEQSLSNAYLESTEAPESITLGYKVYSSRLGNCFQAKSDLTTEYPFPESINNFIIEAPEIKSQTDIVDEFIEKSPSIKRQNKAFKNEKVIDLSAKSTRKKKSNSTETLAKLYASQGNKLKAKKIYQELILKNPEKRSYFAVLIEKL